MALQFGSPRHYSELRVFEKSLSWKFDAVFSCILDSNYILRLYNYIVTTYVSGR
jgi:hypothetical protein